MTDEMRKALDLSQLDYPVFGIDKMVSENVRNKEAMLEAKEAELKAKYGDGWWPYYVEYLCPKLDYDKKSKLMNEDIYNGRMHHISGAGHAEWVMNSYKRQQEVYGDAAERLEMHAPGDPEVAELLLAWGIRTGLWKELPDCLQDEYHRRVGLGESK